jgi:CRISPR-associated endonuclease/helicase Cas3
LVLLHSRFRAPDREAHFKAVERINQFKEGQIIVTTQVLEAGVDISSGMLWTEPAILPSLVQRLGRLNRAGEFGSNGSAVAGWQPTAMLLGLRLKAAPPKEKKEEEEKRKAENEKLYRPYPQVHCDEARNAMNSLHGDASPANIEARLQSALENALKPVPYSLQRHELIDFFDTDSNLSLGYTDVSPFVRGTDPETDVLVIWRDWDGKKPAYEGPPQRDEICAVTFNQQFREFMRSEKWRGALVWQGKDRGWQAASERNCLPGATIMLPTGAGGYTGERGWTGGASSMPVSPAYEVPQISSDEDLLSMLTSGWRSIEEHTVDVQQELEAILGWLKLPDEVKSALREGLLWHDLGKNHPDWKFRALHAVLAAFPVPGLTVSRDAPASFETAMGQLAQSYPDALGHIKTPLAKFDLSKSPRLVGKTNVELRREVYRLKHEFQPGIRHEVASALALRQVHRRDGRPPGIQELLAEYVIMAHHGRVRKALRDELPKTPRPGDKAADTVCGVTEGDKIGDVIIGTMRLAAEPLSIECRKMGRCQGGYESWTKCVLDLLAEYGPFKLAYYETLLRAADGRASRFPKNPYA